MEPTFDLQIHLEGALAILTFQGELTGSAEEVLTQAYQKISQARATNILLQFHEKDYLNSAGIALLIALVSQARKEKRRVGVFGLSKHFQKIFDMIGLIEYLTIYQNEAEARKNSRSSER